MADVIGPNHYLPGQLLTGHPEMVCDDHPDRPAKYRMVGETDSFGSEILDLCEECYDAIKKAEADQAEALDFCEGCKTEQKDCRPIRDPDEGQCGPVYTMCPACRKQLVRYFNEEE